MSDSEKHPAIPAFVEPLSDISFGYEDINKNDKIGSGGEANVYDGTVTVNGNSHRIALKEPRFEGTIQTEVFERFKREAETWSELDSHNNIVSVYGYGVGSLPWIALEYMDGGTLASKTNELDTAEALWMAGRIAEGIHHGHRHGIAHLDLKPTNVLTRQTPEGKWEYPKVSDWGLAKLLLEHSKSVEGLSPTYAAPEQFDADEYGRPDDITDIYQFGVIVYELLTGRPPFTGSATDVMQSILQEEPPAPTDVDSELPPQIDGVILKALEKEKADRYESMVLFRRELDKLFEEHTDENFVLSESGSPSTGHTGTSTAGSTTDVPSEKTAQQSETSDSESSSSGLPRRAAVGVLGTGVVGGGAYAFTQLNIENFLSNNNKPNPPGNTTNNPDQPVDNISLSEYWEESFLNVFATEQLFVGKNTSRGEDAIHYVNMNGEVPLYFPSIGPTYELDLNLGKAFASNEEYVFAAGENPDLGKARLAAFNNDEIERLWTHEIDQLGDEPHVNHLSADQERVYYTQEGGQAQESDLRAINIGSNSIEWETTIEHGYLRGISLQGTTLAVGQSQWLDFYNSETGEKEDQINLATVGDGFTRVRDTLYIVDTEIKAYDLTNREEKWAVVRDRGADTMVATDENALYTGTEGGFLTAHSLSNGEKLWEIRPEHDIDTKPAASNGVVWVCDSTGQISGFGAKTGQRVYDDAELVEPGVQASVTALDSILLVSLLNDGEPYAQAFNMDLTFER
jgi:serine/threonine protein kinase